METPLLSLKGISKSYGQVQANQDIDLAVAPRSIHAILGENGAGKSTLMKLIYGVEQPDAGNMAWNGEPIALASPAAARRQGIGMVFQHFSLFEALTVAENIALSLDPGISLAEISDESRRLSVEYGLPLDPRAHVADLSVGERQRIEIVRALLQNPSLIILDEPTSVLTPQEADRLFETLNKLRAEGRSVLYISHRLEEVQRICDKATVLRHGKVTGACTPRDETAASLARMMVGGEVSEIKRPEAMTTGRVLLEAKGLNAPSRTPFATALKDIYLEVKAG
ncbi:MAG: ATP-binding cassette domain-containing protein, partial [Martelella sp.]